MAAVVIELHNRKYVCGLFWQSLSRPRELRAEAVELARKMNFDLMVLRKDLGFAQAGFASSREGAHKGMLSLGAIVATTIAAKGLHNDGRRQPANSWLGAFRLDDERWAYFAVRDESFLPSGDFAGSKADALERLHADYGLGGWNAVIADPELADNGFHDFHPATIGDFLPRSARGRFWRGSAWGLQPVSRSRQLALAIGGLGVAAIAIGTTTWWYRQRTVEDARVRAMPAQPVGTRAPAIEPRRPAPLPPPWLGRPTPDEFARKCTGQLREYSPGGWRLDEAVCSQAAVSYSWSRGDSNVSYLLEHLPKATVDLSGDKARYAEPLSMQAAPAEDLLKSDQLITPLMSRFQQLGLRLSLKLQPVAPAPPPSLPGVRHLAPPPPPPEWKAFAFSFESRGLPVADLASALNRPGVRVNTMTYRQGDWLVEGVAYAK